MKLHIAALLIALALPAHAQTYVRDADTIVMDGTPVRLEGVAAPERGERYHREGKAWMQRAMREARAIRCSLTGERSWDRWVGVCYFDGQDIGEAVIRAGWARPCRKFVGGRYDEAWRQAPRRDLPLLGYC